MGTFLRIISLYMIQGNYLFLFYSLNSVHTGEFSTLFPCILTLKSTFFNFPASLWSEVQIS